MNIGELDKRVEIQRKTETPTNIGEVTAAWSTLVTVWAKIEPLTGQKLFFAQQVQGKAKIKITIRHYPGLTSNDRLKYGTRLISIVAPPVNINEKGVYDELLCAEVE